MITLASDDYICIMVAQGRMVFLLWTLDQKRSPRAGTGVMIPRYFGSIPVFPAFSLDNDLPCGRIYTVQFLRSNERVFQ